MSREPAPSGPYADAADPEFFDIVAPPQADVVPLPASAAPMPDDPEFADAADPEFFDIVSPGPDEPAADAEESVFINELND